VSEPTTPSAAVSPGRHRAGHASLRRRWRTPLLWLLVAVVALGAAAAVVPTGGTPGDSRAPAGADQAAAGDPAAAEALVAWVDAQLPDGAVLVASPALTEELRQAGLDPARASAAPDLPVSAATSAPVQQLQVTTDPPDTGVVARFGRLSVVDPRPADPAPEQLTARRDLAAALLANPSTAVGPADAEVLAAGAVDPRLLTLLAGVAARLGLGLDSLPPVPGEPAAASARQAVVGAVGGRPLADDPAAADELRSYLAAQQEPYAPARVVEVDGGLLLGFRLVPDPDGLLPAPGGR
jgi:hypothetical protein